MSRPGTLTKLALAAASALTLVACASGAPAADPSAPGATVTVEGNSGPVTIAAPPKAVVATDNRTFETLSSWGVSLKAAPKALMPTTIAYKNDPAIVDLGTHGEPNLEAVVAANPDLIVNGQRFAQHQGKIAGLVPGAKILNLDPRKGQPLDSELKRQTTVLGEVFGKQAEAKKINGDFDAAVARVKAAYKPGEKVMAVNVSGGNIGYIAPSLGRTLGPVYDFVGLTPALKVEGASDDHQGDDISVEAIAKSNPDWILVMDRDAAIKASDPAFKPASEILEASEALKSVTAVQKKRIVYMPADTYTNEGIQTYTEFLTSFADALEGTN